MANITKLEMAGMLAARNDIRITKSFFGLGSKGVYLPTGSALQAFKFSYLPEQQSRIVRLLSTPPERLAQVAADIRLERTAVGNVRLEVCASRDRAFVAVQLLRYQDYLYVPAGEPVVCAGDPARLMAQALALD